MLFKRLPTFEQDESAGIRIWNLLLLFQLGSARQFFADDLVSDTIVLLFNNFLFLLNYLHFNLQIYPMEAQIEQKIKLTSNYDSDRQFMAALNLTEIVQKHQEVIPEKTLVRIIDSLLKLLKEENVSLQDCAIKCLINIISKIPLDQSKRISQIMIQSVSSPTTKEQLRNVYGNAIRSILTNLAYESGGRLNDLLKITIDAILEGSKGNANLKIQQQLIDIAGSYMERWPKIVLKIEFNRIDFTKYLISLILSKGTGTIQKRSYLCLGYYAISMGQLELNTALFDGIIKYLKSGKEVENRRSSYHGLSAILRSNNRGLQEYASQLFEFLFNELKYFRNHPYLEEEQGSEVIYEILQSIISSLNSLVLNFYKEVKQKISFEFIQLICELITFSPFYNISYLANHTMELEEDNQQQQQVETTNDQSYKVRRQVLNIIGLLSKLNSKQCEIFAQQTQLFQSIKEQNLEVRNAAFYLFNHLFEGISIQQNANQQNQETLMLLQQPKLKRVMTSFKQHVPSILQKAVQKLTQLSSISQLQQNTKLNCARLLYNMTKSFSGTIVIHQQLLALIIQTLSAQLEKATIVDIQCYLIDALERLLFKGFHSENYLKFMKLLIKYSSDEDEKRLESFVKATTSLLSNFHTTIKQNNPSLQLIVETIFKYFNKNYRLELKGFIANCVGELFAHYTQVIDPDWIRKFLDTIQTKFKTEIQKKYLLISLRKIESNFCLNKVLVERLNAVLLLVAESFINHQDNFIKQGAHQAIFKIVSVLKKDVSQNNITVLIQKSEILLNDNHFPNYLSKLIEYHPQVFKNNLNLILQCENAPESAVKTIIKQNKVGAAEFLNIIKVNLKKEMVENVIKIISSLQIGGQLFEKQIGDTLWGRICLGVLGKIGNVKYFNDISKYALGNYSQETKYIASISLGDICSLNFKTHIPKLIELIPKVSEQDRYNIFLAIKQATIVSDQFNYVNIAATIENLLVIIKKQKYEKQSILNLISECVAKAIMITQLGSKDLVLKVYEYNQYVFATTFSYLFRDQQKLSQDITHLYVGKLINLLKQGNLDVKAGVLKSLSVMYTYNSEAFLPFFDENLLYSTLSCCNFDKSFLVVLDYGVKITVDKGKNMRIQAFSFLQTILKNQKYKHLDHKLYTEIIRTALKTIDEDPSDDVLIYRLEVIERVTKVSPQSIIPVEKIFSQKLNSKEGKLKQYKVPKPNEDPSIEKLVKNILRSLYNIYKNTRQEFSNEIENFNNDIENVPRFKTILDAIAKLQQ